MRFHCTQFLNSLANHWLDLNVIRISPLLTFQVPVDDPVVMEIRKSQAHLMDVLNSDCTAECTKTTEKSWHSTPGHPFHKNIKVSLVLCRPHEANNVGVVKGRHELDLLDNVLCGLVLVIWAVPVEGDLDIKQNERKCFIFFINNKHEKVRDHF